MNYYAVQALMARAYLWMQDKENAYKTAKGLITELHETANANLFPFVNLASATSPEAPDRVFSTEVLFAVYDINRVGMFNDLFSADLDPNSRLSFNQGNTDFSRVDELYDDANDIRRRSWQNISANNATVLSLLKYQDIADAPGRYMIPLIRLSEVFLIAAETSPNLAEATDYLNQVRLSRNCFDLNPADQTELLKFVGNEFRKEVIGEGQQFYYYKRKASQVMPNNVAVTGTKPMTSENYVVPLPDSEISKRFSDEVNSNN